MYKLKLITDDSTFIYMSDTEELPQQEFLKVKALETWFRFYVRRDLIKFYRVEDKIENKVD